jgi:hypothetical protein
MAKSSGLADERGHTVEQAKAQHPLLDTGKPPASEKTPQGADTMVLAQSAEEVEAQVLNRAGAPDDTHDIEEQMEAAADYDADEADEDADADEADKA